jgi:predicted outer membrane lipoprotein
VGSTAKGRCWHIARRGDAAVAVNVTKVATAEACDVVRHCRTLKRIYGGFSWILAAWLAALAIVILVAGEPELTKRVSCRIYQRSYAMTVDGDVPVADLVVTKLQAAALAAICAVSSEHVDAASDPNPYTQHLTAYDLARLFNLDPSGKTRDTVADLDGIATNVRGTSLPAQRRQHRALWVAHELTRLGYANEAARFAELADGHPASF